MYRKILLLVLFACLFLTDVTAQKSIEQNFLNPPSSAKPWVVWYWLQGAVSKEGITADLEAMKEVGIGGAYLMTIKDTNSKIPFQPQVRQLTHEWWALVKFALIEAKRLQLEIGVHVSDGFALAGGPWIKPENSMQKLVWTKTFVPSANKDDIILPRPEAKQDYYKDIAVFAYPANYSNVIVRNNLKPVVTASNDSAAWFLADETQKQTFRSEADCWIQYSYNQPVTVRQVKIKKQNNPYQSQRFIIQKSDDGVNFIAVDTLLPPRHGWQDWDEPYTHAVRAFSSKYIRFVWKKDGTEPGSEDLDAAKWKPVLKVQGIYISDEPVINNIEAKNGSMWRVTANTTNDRVTTKDVVPFSRIINLTNKISASGKLNWQPPAGQDWVVVRIGHTSTGYMNATAGGGKGLECDKFSVAAATLQFKNWFEKFYTETDPLIAKEVIKVFHMDSWECGSQNWSSNFSTEFKKRRGYDLLPYLVVMTGTPVNDAATSERILHDVRETIAELVTDKFYGTLRKLAHAKGCQFSAESIAPTFVSDGLLHYKNVDLPMGEFWVNSPTHDKPNDMLDAISGAHIYGKNIVGAEAFTILRSDWGEHPGSLKATGDRAFAAGVNKLALHVFMHSPWLNKKPGITLDGYGLFFQRDQTWFKQSKAWIEYLTRCQALLQLGKPVVDIGVFTGEEIPRRSVLPDRLVNTLPGIFGKEKVEAEKKRLQFEGQPQRELPAGVTHSDNMADPENYIDPLNGYQYDCFNPDVLMQMTVKNGRAVTPDGASYALLIVPGKHPMNPNVQMSEAVRKKLKQLADAGVKIVLDSVHREKFENKKDIIATPYTDSTFAQAVIEKDVEVINGIKNIAWAHRKEGDTEIYFISNQSLQKVTPRISFRIKGKIPELYYPMSNDLGKAPVGEFNKNRTEVVLVLEPHESAFVIFRKKTDKQYFGYSDLQCAGLYQVINLDKGWTIKFDKANGGPIAEIKCDTLTSWTTSANDSVKYYSGSAVYTNFVSWDYKNLNRTARLFIDSLWNIATVKVNGVNCGTLWTQPYSIDISKMLKQGENTIEIEVSNTWRNRLIGDEMLPPEKKVTWYNSPYGVKDKPLLPAGITGKVWIRM